MHLLLFFPISQSVCPFIHLSILMSFRSLAGRTPGCFPSISQSVCPFIRLSISQSVFLFIYPLICLSVPPSVQLSVFSLHLSICSAGSSNVHLSVITFISQYVCPLIFPFVHLSVSPSISQFVCPFILLSICPTDRRGDPLSKLYVLTLIPIV